MVSRRVKVLNHLHIYCRLSIYSRGYRLRLDGSLCLVDLLLYATYIFEELETASRTWHKFIRSSPIFPCGPSSVTRKYWRFWQLVWKNSTVRQMYFAIPSHNLGLLKKMESQARTSNGKCFRRTAQLGSLANPPWTHIHNWHNSWDLLMFRGSTSSTAAARWDEPPSVVRFPGFQKSCTVDLLLTSTPAIRSKEPRFFGYEFLTEFPGILVLCSYVVIYLPLVDMSLEWYALQTSELV